MKKEYIQPQMTSLKTAYQIDLMIGVGSQSVDEGLAKDRKDQHDWEVFGE